MEEGHLPKEQLLARRKNGRGSRQLQKKKNVIVATVVEYKVRASEGKRGEGGRGDNKSGAWAL